MQAEQLDGARLEGMSPCEGALAQSSERYASMFTHHPHAAYSVDRNGYYTDANPRALVMTGLSLQQMRQTHFSQVIHPEDAYIIESGFDRALAGAPQVAEARVLRADGQVVEIRCTMIPVVVGGRVVGVHGITEDITDAKQLLRQLEEANAAKTLFLANVSHEVRTPLASIIGATELLMDVELEPEPEHFVQILHRSGQRLMQLVDDLLDFSRLEARQVVLRPRPFDVHALVEGIADWAVPVAESRNLAMSFVVDESVPKSAIGDGLRVTQVVTNLVQNAIKFTECGGVEVRVRSCKAASAARAGAPVPDMWVEFTVTDTGIGIADEDLHAFFEPFSREADRSATHGHQGIGLGLAICRDLIELMGGRLQTFSTIGQGSTFAFSVPLGHCSGSQVDEQGPAAGR
jgi:PAS domain S-box-containing protein